MMARQLSTQDAFLLMGGDYLVILCGLKNDRNGNRRYEATVVNLIDLGGRGKSGAFRYTFTGHCMSPKDEAEWALLNIHLTKAR